MYRNRGLAEVDGTRLADTLARDGLVMSAVGDSTADLVTAELDARAVPAARVNGQPGGIEVGRDLGVRVETDRRVPGLSGDRRIGAEPLQPPRRRVR